MVSATHGMGGPAHRKGGPMRALLRDRTTKIILVVLAAFGLFASGVAVASHNSGHVLNSGGGLVQTKVATGTDSWATHKTGAWQVVAGTKLTVAVPSGSARLLNAHFNAESRCYEGDWCSVRIVARKSGTSTYTEFHPRAGSDFAFDAPDSSGPDYGEGNSVHRSLRLTGGTWYLYVQAKNVGTIGSMFLDDWHFEVNVHTL